MEKHLIWLLVVFVIKTNICLSPFDKSILGFKPKYQILFQGGQGYTRLSEGMPYYFNLLDY